MLAAFVLWPSVAVAQDSEPEPETGAEVHRPGCDGASTAFVVLCESYEFIKEYFVDEVSDEALAAAATKGVLEAGLAARDDTAAPACPLPAPAFEQTCVAIDAVVDTTAAVWAGSKAMFASLGDPRTTLFTPSEYEDSRRRVDSDGLYSGIGLRLGLLDGTKPCRELSVSCRLAVAEVYPGSPAERAGLKPDDILLSLDDYVPSGSGCGLGGLGSLEPGTWVSVVVERDGREMTFTVQADIVRIPAVASRTVAGRTGYLRLGSFGARIDTVVAHELQKLLDSGVETLVLDLRDNPGGLLRTVINIASMFLNGSQVILAEVSKSGTRQRRVSDHGGLTNPALLPIAVTVDGGSASGSEVLALALRGNDRATVVGTTTYGKNTGQRTGSLESRDGTLLAVARVTTFRWLGPGGTSAAGGIQPDVELDWEECWHPVALARQAAASAGLPGTAPVDLDSGTERFEAVEALTADGVLEGTECGPALFCPGDVLPRWVMAVWLVRVLDGQDPGPVSTSRFTDVDAGHWWAGHVERLAELGITGGCASEPARYCPDSPVTRAQMATFFRRAFMLDPAIPTGFEDTRGDVHEAAIDALYRAGITAGCSTEPPLFCPQQSTTRSQMALFLERARNLFN